MLHRVLCRHGALSAVLAACALLAAGLVIVRTSIVSAQSGLNISKAADRVNVHPGEQVMYTIIFTNTGATSAAAVMTDIIPFGVNYVTGSATGGATYVPGPPTAYVSWSGTLNPGEEVTVTFRVLVVEPETLGPYPIRNRAQIDGTWSTPVTIYSTRGLCYLPLVTRNFAPRPVWPWGDD